MTAATRPEYFDCETRRQSVQVVLLAPTAVTATAAECDCLPASLSAPVERGKTTTADSAPEKWWFMYRPYLFFYCAELLSQFGADVIRIEKLSGSEDRYTTPVTEDGQGALFLQMNCNKRGITLNPTRPEGREVVKKLVATADVVLANLPPPTLVEMGIDYKSLKAIKEDIIFTTVSAFGSVGPYSDRLGFDGIGQAMSGAVHMGGFPGQPIKSYAPYVDFGTATSAALGTLVAIMARQQTGKGQVVEGALLRTALCYSNSLMIEQVLLDLNRTGTGNRAQNAGPGNIFNTKDGAVIIQVIGQPLFARWTKLVGADEWLDDPRFATDALRGENGAIISERAAAWCGERTTEQVLAECEAARVPSGPVLTAQQAAAHRHLGNTPMRSCLRLAIPPRK